MRHCPKRSWTVDAFPFFHTGQVFDQLVCPLTVVLPQFFFTLTTLFSQPVFFCLFRAPILIVVHFPVFLRSFRFESFLSQFSPFEFCNDLGFSLLTMCANDLTGWSSPPSTEAFNHPWHISIDQPYINAYTINANETRPCYRDEQEKIISMTNRIIVALWHFIHSVIHENIPNRHSSRDFTENAVFHDVCPQHFQRNGEAAQFTLPPTLPNKWHRLGLNRSINMCSMSTDILSTTVVSCPALVPSSSVTTHQSKVF